MAPRSPSLAGADRNGAVFHIAVADDQHVGDLLHLAVADLLVDLLVAVVHHHADAALLQGLLDLIDIVEVTVGDGQQGHLGGRKPGGQGAGVLLDEVGQGALVAAEGGAVDDVGPHLLPVLVDVGHIELLGQQLVDLDGDEGIFLAKDILVLDIQLGAVEGGFIDADGVLDAKVIEDFSHDALGLIPLLRSTDVLFGIVGIPLGEAEGAVLQQTDGFEAVLSQLQAVAEFLLQLIGAQDDMALRNGELAHTDKTVHLAGILIAEQGGGLTQAHGEIAVAAGAVEEYLVLERAGHGAQGKAFLGLIVGIAQHKHAVQVMIPVAGDLIELALGHQGGLGEEVAALLLGILYPALHQLDHPGALGQQDRQALADDINGGEVFQLTAQLIVVAAAGFL